MPFGPLPARPAQAREDALRLQKHRLVRCDVYHPERVQPSEQISALQRVSVEARGLSDLPVDVARTDHRSAAPGARERKTGRSWSDHLSSGRCAQARIAIDSQGA